MLNLGIRNFKIHMRDRGGVFFSFMGVLVIIALYIFFLGESMKNEFLEVPGGELLIDSWLLAGLIAVTSITTSMGACGIAVEDRVRKNYKDFLSAPLKRHQIVGGYVLNACLVGFVMCLLIFIISEIFLVSRGCALPGFGTVLKILGIIALAVMSSSAVALFISSFLKTNGAFANVSILLGTLIGFLTGMYLPIGSLSENIQWVVKCFPVSHASVLLRQTMMEETLKVSFDGIPVEAAEEFQEAMGVVFTYGNTTGSTGLHIAVLIATTVVFFALGILNLSRKEN